MIEDDVRGAVRLAARTALAAAMATALTATAAAAQERTVTLEDQTGLALTIYNDNLALVQDRRGVTLESGRNRLDFLGLSQQIRPETALLGAEGAAELTVVEQSFRPAQLAPERLLEAFVGETVRLVRVDPQTGSEHVEEAVLLSASGPILRIGDRVAIDPPGHIVLPNLPEGLRAKPVLSVVVDAGAAGKTPVELRYLTAGLSWRADYVAELDSAEDRLDLKGWITLANGSGTGYRDARLSLVAGDVHQVQSYMMRGAEVMSMQAAAPAPKREALFDYHLYRLDRPVTLADGETKQVALLSAEDVPVEKEYRFVDLGNAYDHRMGEPRLVNATVRLSFENSDAAGLGMPLPQGVIRVYGGDSTGALLFLGEDGIGHTPEGEPVRLTLGQAFDVTARSRQTDFEQLGERAFETAFTVALKNAKPQPVTVTVVEHFPGEWEILEESHRHEGPSAQQAEWTVPVPANGTTELSYRVRVTY